MKTQKNQADQTLTVKQLFDRLTESGDFGEGWDNDPAADEEIVERLVRIISFEQFHVMNGCLAGFCKREQLRKSCNEAIVRLGSTSFEGKLTCAAIMGRAMEILKRDFRANAPKGWVPVIKRLREEAHAESPEERRHSVAEFLHTQFPSPEPVVPPEPVLSEEELQKRREQAAEKCRKLPLREGLVWDQVGMRLIGGYPKQPVLREIYETVNAERERNAPIPALLPRTFAQTKPCIERAIELAKERNVDSSVLEQILQEIKSHLPGGADAECVLSHGHAEENNR